MFTRVIRKRVAVEDGATSSDVKGEDARLRAPGVDWNSIVDLRDLCLADFKGKIQSVFETLLHRIGEARYAMLRACVVLVGTVEPRQLRNQGVIQEFLFPRHILSRPDC